ncbi:cytochrome P450 [Echria macrotheca]|uniref:Cytochrome P450 n=1 Tax=Echria macrotheca TaxID=438768 RepID=A0AAJ0FFS2_9PEZI|nr:cytochrome P450 [Echria macrotheca]
MALITFWRATLASAIEILLAKRLGYLTTLPVPLPLAAAAVLVFCANYAAWLLWITLIVPFCLDPLRKFPAPRVVTLSRLLTRLRNSDTYPPGQFLLEVAERTPNEGIVVLQGQATSLLLTKPGPLADVLVHHPYDFAKFEYVRDFLRPVLGDGLVVVEGERHKFLRRNAQGAFKFGVVRELYGMMWEKAVAFSEVLQRRVVQEEAEEEEAGTRVEMNGWASKVTLDIIGIAAFGRDFQVLTHHDDPLIRNYDELMRPGRAKFFYFIVSAMMPRWVVRWMPWRVARMFEQTTASIKAICGDMVRDKAEAIARAKDDGEHLDILSMLIKTSNFSSSELVDQLLTFLAAGHETTSSVFTWATYLLSTRPVLQQALRSEILTAFPSFPDVPQDVEIASVLEHLPYLNGILSETLRLFPTVPVTVRVAVRDTTLSGYPINKGTEIVLSPWQVNRYTEIWGPDATKFRPERWIVDGKFDPTGGVASNYAHMTFLHGPRACIGQGFARAELRCLLAAFAGRMRWELDMAEGTVVPGGVITIRPVNGLYLRLFDGQKS